MIDEDEYNHIPHLYDYNQIYMSIILFLTTPSSGIVTEPTFKSILLQIFSMFDAHFDRKRPPPGGFFYLLCSPIKNPEEEDPPRTICPPFEAPEGVLFLRVLD